MFSEVNYTKDLASILEERKLLQQLVSLGVGYPYGRSWLSKSAIMDTKTLQYKIERELHSQKYSDVGSIIGDAKDRIQNGGDGYYFLDLDKGRILAGEQYPVEDIIIDFTLPGAEDRILLRRKKGTHLHVAEFLIAPNGVYFLWDNSVSIPLSEFHMLSFISIDNDSTSGLVVDYDSAQNNRPAVLFPFKENNDILQSQLEHDDHCRRKEFESLIRDIGSKKI